MSKLVEDMAYLKGLAEGMKIAEQSDVGSITDKLLSYALEAAKEVQKQAEQLTECRENISSLLERVAKAEKQICFLQEDMEDAYVYLDELRREKRARDKAKKDSDIDDDDLFGDLDNDDDLFEMTCPKCGEDIVISYDMLDEDDTIFCPHCNNMIDLDFDLDDDDDDDWDEDDDEDDEDDEDDIND